MRILYLTLLIYLSIILAYSQDYDIEDDYEASENIERNVNRPVFFPGIYLTFDDFTRNAPVFPQTIVTERDFESADFYFHLCRESKVEYVNDGALEAFNPAGIWGYSDGRSVFINRRIFPSNFFDSREIAEHPYSRITDIGELSLIHYIQIYASYSQFNASIGHTNVSKRHASPKEFILNTQDGKIHLANLKNLELLLAQDKELLDEFKKDKSDKDIKMYIFLRKYNKRHPLQFGNPVLVDP